MQLTDPIVGQIEMLETAQRPEDVLVERLDRHVGQHERLQVDQMDERVRVEFEDAGARAAAQVERTQQRRARKHVRIDVDDLVVAEHERVELAETAQQLFAHVNLVDARQAERFKIDEVEKEAGAYFEPRVVGEVELTQRGELVRGQTAFERLDVVRAEIERLETRGQILEIQVDHLNRVHFEPQVAQVAQSAQRFAIQQAQLVVGQVERD